MLYYENDNSHPGLGLEVNKKFTFEAKLELGLGESENSSLDSGSSSLKIENRGYTRARARFIWTIEPKLGLGLDWNFWARQTLIQTTSAWKCLMIVLLVNEKTLRYVVLSSFNVEILSAQ